MDSKSTGTGVTASELRDALVAQLLDVARDELRQSAMPTTDRTKAVDEALVCALLDVAKLQILNGPDASGSALWRSKLEFIYVQLLSLLEHEGRFVSERFAHAITVQSILFASFFLVMTAPIQANLPLEPETLQTLIAVCGLISAVFYCSMISRTLVSMTFWRSTIVLIEKDDRFWWPAENRNILDYDIFSARVRLNNGLETRQTQSPSFLTRRAKFIAALSRLVRDPHDFYAIYFPLMFCVLWIVLARPAVSHILGW